MCPAKDVIRNIDIKEMEKITPLYVAKVHILYWQMIHDNDIIGKTLFVMHYMEMTKTYYFQNLVVKGISDAAICV